MTLIVRRLLAFTRMHFPQGHFRSGHHFFDRVSGHYNVKVAMVIAPSLTAPG